MAQRFGGRYSTGQGGKPDGTPPAPPAHPFDGRRPARSRPQVNMLFAAPLFLLYPAFTGAGDALVFGLTGTFLCLAGAWMTREGIRAEEAYDARRIARRPAFPRKIAGSLLTGAGLGLAATIGQPELWMAAGIGIVAAALHAFSFGLDPMSDKGGEGIDAFQTARVARAVDEAERLLSGMKDAILRARDPQIEARVDRFAQTARAMFRTVEGDPRDLTAARKYLSVYLQGARDASVKFADLYGQSRDARARADYLSLLDDLETNFASRTQALLSDNRTDLDIEIGVLKERLQREG
jgi:hypothetical protein